jgi:hypothetical protein
MRGNRPDRPDTGWKPLEAYATLLHARLAQANPGLDNLRFLLVQIGLDQRLKKGPPRNLTGTGRVNRSA